MCPSTTCPRRTSPIHAVGYPIRNAAASASDIESEMANAFATSMIVSSANPPTPSVKRVTPMTRLPFGKSRAVAAVEDDACDLLARA